MHGLVMGCDPDVPEPTADPGGASLLSGNGFSPGRRRSTAKDRASRSCVWEPVVGSFGIAWLGRGPSEDCLCWMSNRRRNACRQRSTPAAQGWSRMASGSVVHEVRPVSGAATIE
ncbi:hypothetical protein GCM10010452_13150 [Crossiella cryophila]